MVLGDVSLGDLLWSLIVIFFMVIYFMILFQIIVDVFRRHSSGWNKAWRCGCCSCWWLR